MEGSQEKNDVHLVYKNLGETPLGAIQRFKKDNPSYMDRSVTYAGRLDPMAEGLLILLSNDEVMDKDKYLDLPKTYVVEMLWGVETDTLDVLGKITNFKLQILKQEDIEKFLEKSVGKFEQEYPIYSSKPVRGKPLFQWAREGMIDEIDIPKHEVEIFNAKFLERNSAKGEDVLKNIEEKVSLATGDFRQAEILEKWRLFLSGVKTKDFNIDKFELRVSSGFYVRQFVSDMAKNFGCNATTFHIKRTQVGDYKI